MINLVAAVGKNLELGKNGKLIFHIPNDLKYFKDLTLGHTVVMGRRTLESIGKALENRENIVITRKDIEMDNVVVVHDYKELLGLENRILPEVRCI